MDPSYEVVELRPEDSAELEPLFAEVWPGVDHGSRIRWAFGGNPIGASLILVARERGPGRGRVVGARGSIAWPIAGARRVHQFHGTCVHPAHRRRGIFSALNQAFLARFEERGGEAVFNISVAESRAGYEKLGWAYLPGLRRWILPARPWTVIRALLESRQSLRGRPSAVRSQRDPLPSESFVSALSEAREEALRGLLHTVYDPSFFRWRHADEAVPYRFIARPAAGLLSYRLQSRGRLREALIGDIWPRDWRWNQVARLLGGLLRRERPALVSIVLTTAHPLRRRLSFLGFVPDPKGDLNFGVRPLSQTDERLVDPRRWALSTADIDTF